jgi:hypothetical protein
MYVRTNVLYVRMCVCLYIYIYIQREIEMHACMHACICFSCEKKTSATKPTKGQRDVGIYVCGYVSR